MINFIKDKDFYFLNLGHDFISNSPKRVIPVSRDEATAIKVQTVMQEIYNQIGLEYHTYVTTINKTGVKIIAE